MRRILSDFGAEVRKRLVGAPGPVERVHAIIAASFGPEQFDREIVAAWLAFYVEAQKSRELRRLLRVYARRLNSDLMSGLTPLMNRIDALNMAEAIAAMIDGLYIRRALRDGLPNPASATALVEDYVETKLRRLQAANDENGAPARRVAASPADSEEKKR